MDRGEPRRGGRSSRGQERARERREKSVGFRVGVRVSYVRGECLLGTEREGRAWQGAGGGGDEGRVKGSRAEEKTGTRAKTGGSTKTPTAGACCARTRRTDPLSRETVNRH